MFNHMFVSVWNFRLTQEQLEVTSTPNILKKDLKCEN